MSVEAIGCEIVIFLEFNRWAHEYIAIFVNIDRHRTWGRIKRAGGI